MLEDVNAPTRAEVIKDTSVFSVKRDDLLFRKFGDEADYDEQWWLIVVAQRGSLPETTSIDIYETEADALAAERAILNGEEDNQTALTVWQSMIEKIEFKHGSEQTTPFDILAGLRDFDDFLPNDVIEKSGLCKYSRDTGWDSLSQDVMDTLGELKVRTLRRQWGSLYYIPALMEYAVLKLPESSATMAAIRYKYHRYISAEELTAGYYLRDLEIICGGLEIAAQMARDFLESQAARAKMGGGAQAAKAKERKSVFNELALGSIRDWIAKSEAQQVRYLKRLIEKSEFSELFLQNHQLLSNDWFKNALSSLRQSGAIESYFSKI